MMDLERERKIERLCQEAMDLPHDKLEAWLETACADDPAIAGEVKDLIGWMDHTQQGLWRTQAKEYFSPSDEIDLLRETAQIGNMVGPYYIISELGEGGMGCVFLAEQKEPVKRQVALKLVLPNRSDSKEDQRIRAESQAMALLSHPNIAKVYDVGVTEEGVPYLAMEYVSGEPLGDYCDKRKMPLDQRLWLFFHVCRGVQHAHQKGILHRDLKPSNILVTEFDGRPVPKIIDFGIAKNMEATGIITTTIKGIAGTPAYMSPEAVDIEESGLDIDTRADVYALGVLLYETVCGLLPFDTKTTVVKILEMISRGGIPRPSARLSHESPDIQSELAVNRGQTVSGLKRHLTRDLDWIIGKATARDREERYASASQLANDLKRYLRHQRVLAAPAGPVYKARKFIGRHAFSLATALLITVLGGVLISARLSEARQVRVEAERARMALAESRQISQFMIGLFDYMDPRVNLGEDLSPSEMIERSAKRAETEFREQPLVRAYVLYTLGLLQRKLGNYNLARNHHETALTLHETHLGPDHPDMAENLYELGLLYGRIGKLEESLFFLERSLLIRKEAFGAEHSLYFLTLGDLAGAYGALGLERESVDVYKQLIAAFEQGGDLDARKNGIYHLQLGIALMSMGDYGNAEIYVRKGFALLRDMLDPKHPNIPRSLATLARVLRQQGRYEASLSALEEALPLREEVHGPNHPFTAFNLIYMSETLIDMGRLNQAETAINRALRILEERLDPEHPDIARCLLVKSVLERRLGCVDTALDDLFRSAEIYAKTYGPDSVRYGWTLVEIGRLLARKGFLDDAEILITKGLLVHKGRHPDAHPERVEMNNALSELYLKQGRLAEVEVLLNETLAICERTWPREHVLYQETMTMVASLGAKKEDGQSEDL